MLARTTKTTELKKTYSQPRFNYKFKGAVSVVGAGAVSNFYMIPLLDHNFTVATVPSAVGIIRFSLSVTFTVADH